jgi:multidrug efflux pump subunit AcrA (membrane-fusion protein)
MENAMYRALATIALLTTVTVDAAETSLELYNVSIARAPLEHAFDGTIEAVNQGTVSAQTSGRVAQVLYDVNDFVPAGAVIVRLRGHRATSEPESGGSRLKESNGGRR